MFFDLCLYSTACVHIVLFEIPGTTVPLLMRNHGMGWIGIYLKCMRKKTDNTDG